MNLTDVYRTFHPTAAKYVLLKCPQKILQDRSYHRLQTSLNKFKKIKFISRIYSKHKGMKLEIKRRRKAKNFTNIWKLNNKLLNSPWVKTKIKREIVRISWKKNGNKADKNLWDETKAVLRGKFISINTCIKKQEK